jgi:hypothetical protein
MFLNALALEKDVQHPGFIVVCFHLGDSPASEFNVPTFQNTLSVPSSKAGKYEE